MIEDVSTTVIEDVSTTVIEDVSTTVIEDVPTTVTEALEVTGFRDRMLSCAEVQPSVKLSNPEPIGKLRIGAIEGFGNGEKNKN